MDAKELRIGNWVIINDKSIQWGLIHFEYGYVVDAQPIPLTPEILGKCGFEKSSEDTYGGYLISVRPSEKIRVRLKNGKWGWDLFTYNPVDCHYLHQLQNLYFALTGTELDIKL